MLGVARIHAATLPSTASAAIASAEILHDGVRIAVAGQPFLSGRAIGGKMDKLGIVAGAVEYENRADSRPPDDCELQLAVHRECPVDTQDDRALTAVIALVQGDVGRIVVADAGFGLFSDQATARASVFPGGELAVALRRSRRAIGISQGRAQGHEVVDHFGGHGFLHGVDGGKPPRRYAGGGMIVHKS